MKAPGQATQSHVVSLGGGYKYLKLIVAYCGFLVLAPSGYIYIVYACVPIYFTKKIFGLNEDSDLRVLRKN